MSEVKRDNQSRAHELIEKTGEWFDRTFNCIPLELVEKATDNCLFEYTTPPGPEDVLEEWVDYADSDRVDELRQEHAEEEGIDVADIDDDDFAPWLEQNASEFSDFVSEKHSDYYPMWGTLFEFRYDPTPDVLSAARGVGLGVIEGVDSLRTMLFAMSAGHNFYSSYWIPLYLQVNETDANEYKDVNYQGM